MSDADYEGEQSYQDWAKGVHAIEGRALITSANWPRIIIHEAETATADRLLEEQQAQKRVMEEFARKQRMLDEYGNDEYDNGQVIRFSKQFAPAGTVYMYAAIKANGLWYTTGPKAPKGYSWDELVLWLLSGACPVPKSRVDFMVEEFG